MDMRISSAITIGFFDGVHRGHRYLLGQLEKLAGAKGLLPVAVTFDQHPRQVLKEGEAPLLLTTQAEKMSLLANAFNGETIILPFTQEMGAMSAKEFMRSVLCEKLNARLLLMGYNHRFGHGGGTPEEYATWGRETGIEVCWAEALSGKPTSSSRIRNLIVAGEIEEANAMLGYRYFIEGLVTDGKHLGRKIGFPTANIEPPEQKLLPACGVYAVEVTLPNGSKRGGMLCIGHRPTIETNGNISVEVHIFNYCDGLYGEQLFVEFIGRIRDEKPFSSLDALKHQLMQDAVSVRTIIERSE